MRTQIANRTPTDGINPNLLARRVIAPHSPAPSVSWVVAVRRERKQIPSSHGSPLQPARCLRGRFDFAGLAWNATDPLTRLLLQFLALVAATRLTGRRFQKFGPPPLTRTVQSAPYANLRARPICTRGVNLAIVVRKLPPPGSIASRGTRRCNLHRRTRFSLTCPVTLIDVDLPPSLAHERNFIRSL